MPVASRLILALTGVVAPVFLVTAQAATTTATMAVTATVSAVCSVVALPLAFGTYTPGSTPSDASTTVSVTCTNGTTYTVALDAGLGSGATTTNRVMTGPGGGALNYAIYTNAGRTTRFGNTVGTDTVAGTGIGAVQTVNVYGRIPGNQYPTPGLYNDSVTITLTY